MHSVNLQNYVYVCINKITRFTFYMEVNRVVLRFGRKFKIILSEKQTVKIFLCIYYADNMLVTV